MSPQTATLDSELDNHHPTAIPGIGETAITQAAYRRKPSTSQEPANTCDASAIPASHQYSANPAATIWAQTKSLVQAVGFGWLALTHSARAIRMPNTTGYASGNQNRTYPNTERNHGTELSL
jgi:hypothetical protein